jgi:hypothetical protein
MESLSLSRSPSSPEHPVANLLSPSITDSAIDMDAQDTRERDGKISAIGTTHHHHHNSVPLIERFATLVNLISDPTTQSHLEHYSYSSTIHQHLDHVERLLDPRRDITFEITKQRPRSSSRPKSQVTTTSSPQANKSNTPRTMQSPAAVQDQVSGLFESLKSVTEQLQHRRRETSHLNALFTMKCEAMAQRIIALENEVHEL